MRVIKRLLLLVVAVGVGFLVMSVVSKEAQAAEVGSEMEFQGMLEKHPNANYTHRIAGQNVNLTLGDNYVSMEGKEVKVKVKFVSENTFSVLSITEVGDIAGTGATTGGGVRFQGVLVKHDNENYTHKLQDQNVNLILDEKFNEWEGSEVEMEVEFYGGSRFRILWMVQVGNDPSASSGQEGEEESEEDGEDPSTDSTGSSQGSSGQEDGE